MKLVFLGTPSFAVPTLQQLLRAGHSVELVVTQPDRPIGRSRELAPTAVKLVANQEGLPVLQPERIKNNPEFAAHLRAIGPDAIIAVAYGRIVPKWMLELPPLGNLNLHASLLPKYRGAAPIQWAIANGEPTTGVTTMRMDEGLDTGDILLQHELVIAPDQTAADISPLLAESGASLMIETLDRLAAGSLEAVPQDSSAASLAPILKREDALVDFSRSATSIYNRWRGFQPWPGAYTFFRGKKLILHRLMPVEGVPATAAPKTVVPRTATPGTILVERDRLLAAAGQNSWLQLIEVQLEGKKRLLAGEFLHGATPAAGERLGEGLGEEAGDFPV